MKIFKIVQAVLDAEYEAIAGSPAERDKKISAKLDTLSKNYSKILETDGPDYSSAECRFAYVFRYSTAHASMIEAAISKCKTLKELFATADHVHIACIGGGPGSEILGVLKYLDDEEKPSLRFDILDLEVNWSETWSGVDDLVRKFSKGVAVSKNFIPLDAANEESWSTKKKMLGADLFVLSWFVSEVYNHRDKAKDFFEHLMGEAKEGALFLYVDFSYPDLSEWIDKIAKSCGLETVMQKNKYDYTVSPDEEKKDLKKYLEKFGNPKLKSFIDIRVWRVPAKSKKT